MIKKIISGGQTGADRAALDVALKYGMPHGGWCPAGRLAEDGELDAKYELNEIEHGRYRQRTKRNVLESDGTLILNLGELNGGTLATQKFTQQLKKPCYIVKLDSCAFEPEVHRVIEWILVNEIAVLNVAGPSESKNPSIYALSIEFMTRLHFSLVKN